MFDRENEIRKALRVLGTSLSTLELESVHPDLPAVVKQQQSWSRSPGVVGLGLSPKKTGGRSTDTLALKVYVEEKLPSSSVDHDQVIPTSLILPGFDSPLPTDVEALGKQQLELYTTRSRPIQPAFSIGIVSRATGTLGCLVRRRGNPNDLFVLSNSHVLAGSGLAPAQTPIIQPGPDDGGTAEDVVALLDQSIVFNFDSGTSNLCDAAIAKIVNGVGAIASLPDIGQIQGVNSALQRGMAVQKSGRTTGHTTSTVKDIDYQTFMSYPSPSGGVANVGFRSQVLCERYSDGGDSGSLVCDEQGRAVGLHWCGSTTASVFSPISFVLDAFQVELVLAL